MLQVRLLKLKIRIQLKLTASIVSYGRGCANGNGEGRGLREGRGREGGGVRAGVEEDETRLGFVLDFNLLLLLSESQVGKLNGVKMRFNVCFLLWTKSCKIYRIFCLI